MSLINKGIYLFNFTVREVIKDFYERSYSINEANLPEGTFGNDVILKGNIKISKNSFISSRAIMRGHITIGKNTFIGAGAIICGDISVGDNCFIDCGAVVTMNLKNKSYAFGNPLRVKAIKKIVSAKLYPDITEDHSAKKTKIQELFPWMMTCGKNVFFGDQIYVEGGGDIEIGDNTKIFDRVMLATAHHVHNKKEDFLDTQQHWYSIKIGKNVKIYENSVIRGGVTIGEGATILPGSIVVKDILPNSVAQGAPATPNAGQSSKSFVVFPHITNKFAVYGHMYAAVNYFNNFKNIKISNKALINKELCIVGDKKVIIKSNCLVSPRVMLVTQTPLKSGDIILEENTWIGAESIICPGVKISRGAVVGAGSVVYETIPENEIWGGNPAKKISVRKNGQ